PSIVNVHSSSGVCGVGPADKTGKSSVRYWPGGNRPLSSPRPRPRNPRETIPTRFSLSRATHSKRTTAHHPGARGPSPRAFRAKRRTKGRGLTRRVRPREMLSRGPGQAGGPSARCFRPPCWPTAPTEAGPQGFGASRDGGGSRLPSKLHGHRLATRATNDLDGDLVARLLRCDQVDQAVHCRHGL